MQITEIEARRDADGVYHIQVIRLLNAYHDGIMSADEVCEQLREDNDVHYERWVKLFMEENERTKQ
jgi:hypothetical protein